MTFCWDDFLEVARDLDAQAPDKVQDEAKLRCAVSRAYYAAFHSARAFLRAEDPSLSERIRHEEVHDKFIFDADPQRKTIGLNLKDIKQKRHKADYKLPYPDPNIKSDASYMIMLAEDVIEDISNLASR